MRVKTASISPLTAAASTPPGRVLAPGCALVGGRRVVPRLGRELLFEQVERFLRVRGRQPEFFGEVRADRAGEHSDPYKGNDAAEDTGLAVPGAPGCEAAHRGSTLAMPLPGMRVIACG